jgi:hypothetical protein
MEENNGSLPDLEAGSFHDVSKLGSGDSIGQDRDNKFSLSTVREETGASQLSITVGDGNNEQARQETKEEHFNLSPGDQEQQQLQDHNHRLGSDGSQHESNISLNLSLGDTEESGKANARKSKVQFHDKPTSIRALFPSIKRSEVVRTSATRQCVQVWALLASLFSERAGVKVGLTLANHRCASIV